MDGMLCAIDKQENKHFFCFFLSFSFRSMSHLPMFASSKRCVIGLSVAASQEVNLSDGWRGDADDDMLKRLQQTFLTQLHMSHLDAETHLMVCRKWNSSINSTCSADSFDGDSWDESPSQVMTHQWVNVVGWKEIQQHCCQSTYITCK